MKTTKKVIQWGMSLGVIIDKFILTKLKIRKGDLIEITIKKIE